MTSKQSSTWDPWAGQRPCRMCGKPEHGSVACEAAAGWPDVNTEVTYTATRLDPYFVYERIAGALERIAAALEHNQDSESA